MTLDDELTRLEQRAVKYGLVNVSKEIREQLLRYLPVKSEAFTWFSKKEIRDEAWVDLDFVLNMNKVIRTNIARLTAERLTK
jgi:hypothetical protein